MDYYIKSIKNEPEETEEHLNECILCEDGRKYYNLLIQHFRNQHSDYNLYEDGPILQYCKCAESVNYQLQIITHLLSHSILNSDLNTSNDDIIKQDVVEEEYVNYQEIPEEEEVVYDYDRFEEEREEEQEPPSSPETSKKTRRRKRKSSDSGGERSYRKKGRSLYCKICQKQFDTIKKYYNHKAKVHRDKLHCDQCDQQFVFKHKLRDHIEFVHMGKPKVKVNRVKKFQCHLCSMQFTELRILNEHTNIHNDIRPFICEFCSEAFHNSANLRYHRKRHLNPDGYKCPVCQESFVNQQSLRKHHIRQHLEADLDPHRFVCQYADCGSSFKYEDLLKQHVKKIHHRILGEFTCEICNFVTNNKQNYFQHRRRLHDIRNRKGNRVFPASSTKEDDRQEQNYILENY